MPLNMSQRRIQHNGFLCFHSPFTQLVFHIFSPTESEEELCSRLDERTSSQVFKQLWLASCRGWQVHVCLLNPPIHSFFSQMMLCLISMSYTPAGTHKMNDESMSSLCHCLGMVGISLDQQWMQCFPHAFVVLVRCSVFQHDVNP